MERSKLLELTQFFKNLEIEEEDVTSDLQRANGQFVVIVTYTYDNKKYITKKLYYKNINQQDYIKNPNWTNSFFCESVYWLDISHHDWPQGQGGKIEARIIGDMINPNDTDFKSLLQSIANDNKTGFIQSITKEGRPQQYGFNLENNNHWHDIIKLIKVIIINQGREVDKKNFSRLVFKWDKDKDKDKNARVPFHLNFGQRAIIRSLYKNISSIQNDLENMDTIKDIINLLRFKHQIILQGPPGTGKTRMAKLIANEIGENQIIQFHPAYSYEDFVRGICVKTNTNNQVEYIVENRTLAKFAQKAIDDSGSDYVLIIDEINRANLPSVLGELIYALEYRGEAVESMYALKTDNADSEGNTELILPKNLYIIGTMNTADRSVGHIDYAIRRRFAFVDVPPTDKAIDAVITDIPLRKKAKDLYFAVSELFKTENLASDFQAKDVQLGHSYFLVKTEKELELKLKYEILPILHEYLKDGILLESVKSKIEALNV